MAARGHPDRRRVVGALLALLAAALLLAAAPASSRALSWSAAVNPLRPDADPGNLGPLSCPSTTLCVAADGYGWGDLLVSTDPLAGATSFGVTTLPGASFISSVACPSAGLCVAGDGDGDVWTSIDPSAGFTAWRRTHLEDPLNTDGLSGMACPSTSLCVATDVNGNVWSSSDPTGGRAAWHHARIPDGGANVNGPASCPTTSLCVALTETGRTYATTRPLTGGWAVTASPRDPALDPAGLTCPAVNLCVTGAADAYGADRVFANSDPAGSGAWTRTTLPGARSGGIGVSCSSAVQCLAYDTHGGLFSSTAPAVPGSWQAGRLGVGVATNVHCFDSPDGCLAVGAAGAVFTAPAATGPWAGGLINGWSPVSAVDCPTASTCLAVDTAGDVLHTTEPAGAAPDWSVVTPRGAGAFGSLTCLRPALCLAGAQHSSLWLSRRPTGAATAWTRLQLTGLGRESGSATVANGTGVEMTGIACPSPSLCVAVDDTGDVLASTDPTGSPLSWKVLLRLPSQGTRGGDVPEGLTYVTCPSVHLCLAGDPVTSHLEGTEAGTLLVSHHPAQAGSWHGRRVGLSTVTCPSAHLCLAGTASGRLAYSRHPAGVRRAWRYLRLRGANRDDAGQAFTSIACDAARQCVAGGAGEGGGAVLESSTPTVAGSWQVTQLSGSSIDGAGCFAGPVCVAYSHVGELFVGH